MPDKTVRDLVATYLRPHRSRLVLLAACFVGGVGLQLLNPLLAKTFIDRASEGEPFDQLVRLAAVFLAVALLTQVATVAEVYVAEDLGWRTTNALRADLTSHVLALDDSFHADHGAGELLERIDGDVGAIAGFTCSAARCSSSVSSRCCGARTGGSARSSPRSRSARSCT